MTKPNYQYIVIGCGGIGSGAAYWLSRRAGNEVLGIEQFELGHGNGGSHGYSRIIRLLGYGPEVMRRYPQFRIDARCEAMIQDDTGIADPSQGNAAHQQLARHHGATILDNCPVEAIKPFDGGVRVECQAGTFTCRRLVITAGTWAGRLLAQLDLAMELLVTQEQFTYYATPNLRDFAVGNFPIFLSPTKMGEIYGFPVQGEVATKVAIDLSGDAVTADTRSFEPNAEVETFQEAWLREHIPGFLGPKLYSKTCLYTMPLDRQFVLDKLPGHPQISLCIGAGHAYKFASLFGKILSELAIDDKTQYPIDSMKWDRPGIADRAQSPVLQRLEQKQ